MVAIDGRCGSGKTTLGEALREELGGNLFHTDDFYLPFEHRAPDWERVATRNMDFKRLREEVLLPAGRGERIAYGAYDPHRRKMRSVACAPEALSILEGSYSHHPSLRDAEELCVFLTCDRQTQEERLRVREGDNYVNFVRRWIPLEEQYFREYRIEERCDMRFFTGRQPEEHAREEKEESAEPVREADRERTRRETLDASVAFFKKSSFWNGQHRTQGRGGT